MTYNLVPAATNNRPTMTRFSDGHTANCGSCIVAHKTIDDN